jgi:hypothetical protein
MRVRHLKSKTLHTSHHQFDLKRLDRQQLGEAILNTLHQREEVEGGGHVLAEVEVTERQGRVWIDAADGPYIGLPLEAVVAAPELLGVLLLEALEVPPRYVSYEHHLYVVFDGRRVAFLTDPQWEEMFWTSYQVVFFEEIPEFEEGWWRQDHRLEYVHAVTGEELPAFGHFWEDTGRAILRGTWCGEPAATSRVSRARTQAPSTLMFLLPTPAVASESARVRILYAAVTLFVAAALAVAALDPGSPDTLVSARVPGYVDVVACAVCAPLAILVLAPRTRALASAATAALMVASMVASYVLGGLAFFLQALTFDLVVLVSALALAWRHWR